LGEQKQLSALERAVSFNPQKYGVRKLPSAIAISKLFESKRRTKGVFYA
jgi:hypothetical protein